MLSPLTAGWTLLIDSRHQRPVGTLIAGRLRRSEAGGRAVPARPRLLFRRAPRPLSYPSLLSVFSSFSSLFSSCVAFVSLFFSLSSGMKMMKWKRNGWYEIGNEGRDFRDRILHFSIFFSISLFMSLGDVMGRVGWVLQHVRITRISVQVCPWTQSWRIPLK